MTLTRKRLTPQEVHQSIMDYLKDDSRYEHCVLSAKEALKHAREKMLALGKDKLRALEVEYGLENPSSEESENETTPNPPN
jgi:hypothetical protein